MGKVLVTAKIDNLNDLVAANDGRLTAEQVRTIEVTDALADSGATTLLLPKRIIAQLGLQPLRRRQSRTINGTASMQMYRAVRLTVQDRDCICDVGEVSDEFPVIIGQIPLESLDWLIDSKNQRLIGNPEHGGEQMIDVL